MERPTVVAAVRHGYSSASSPERSGFGLLSAFALTMAAARAVTYAQERRRDAPLARSLWRRLSNAPRAGGVRVHHFVPGLGIALAAGGAAVVTRTDGCELRFGLPFGVGTALALDELALLIDVDNAYWRSQRPALFAAGGAALGAAALGASFGHRGGAFRIHP